MKLVIIGAGAMGSLFSARLSPLTEVWLLGGWTDHISVIKKDGLQLTEPDGHESTIPVRATTAPADVGQDADLAVIFVKSPQTAQAARLAADLLRPQGLALSLQNGLGNIDLIVQELGPDQAVQGVTSHGATLLGPGRVRHAGIGATHLAFTPGLADRIKAIADLFVQAGFETHLTDNLESLLWGKLIVNAGINALTAILQVPNGVLLQVEPASQLMAAAVSEAAMVAQAKGVTLPYSNPQARIRQVVSATATNRSSMLADVVRAVPTEIEVINGAIVREGAKLGIDTPVNKMLVWLVKSLESTYQQRIQ